MACKVGDGGTGRGWPPNRPNRPLPLSAFKIPPDVDLDNGRGAPALRQTEPNRQSRGPPAMSLHLIVVLEFSSP